MILQALHKYYQAMQARGAIAPFGMEYKNIPFILVISPEGDLVDFIDTRDKDENKLGRKYLVAATKGRSGSKSYEVAQILWDHSGYVLGMPTAEEPNKAALAPKQHEAFKLELQALIDAYPNNQELRAIQRFYEREQHLTLKEEHLDAIRKKVGANISFRLSTEPNPHRLIASHPDITSYVKDSGSNDDKQDLGRCLVTGLRQPIARLHGGISLFGAQPGANLISFQKGSGYDSYGKEQGYNAPISIGASDAITTALNSLLAFGKDTNYRIGETTFVFWSTLQSDELLDNYKKATFTSLIIDKADLDEAEAESEDTTPAKKRRSKSGKKSTQGPNPEEESRKVLAALKSIRGDKGRHIDRTDRERFYILGLAPNAKRISVKLWMEGTVSEIVSNTLQHLDDMNIVRFGGISDPDNPPLRSLFHIMSAVSSSAKSDKWSALMIQGIVESIVKGLPYPKALQQACMERILHDHTSTSPVSETRAAILKACINRTYKQERIPMALDRSNTDQAYLAGRLFAVLENIQRAAINGANTSITDNYYRSACCTPGIIFGRLIQLSNHHLSKIKKEKPGLAVLFRRELEQIFELLPGNKPEFSKYFNLDQQSIFSAGYYHQRIAPLKSEDSEQTDSE